MEHTVIGLFDSLDTAQQVVTDLVKAGFERKDISLVANDASNTYSKYVSRSGAAVKDDAVTGAEGASFGTVVGALTGVLVGLGALAIPGIGPVLAAGPLIAALGGGAVGAVAGAATGGIVGSLVKTGVPEEEAQSYAEGIRRGGTLVTVNANDDNMAHQAADIMNAHSAVDVHERAAQWRESGWKGYDANAKPYTTEDLNKFRSTTTAPSKATQQQDGKMVLPVVEEQLKVGKRDVERGGVRAYTRVTETPVEEQVQLREERVKVERRPVDRPVTAADTAFKETSIEMTEHAEEAVVSKTARVIEEVVISKETTQRNETVRDTVRRTDVQVDQSDAENAGWNSYAKDFETHYKTNYGKSGYTYDQYAPAYRYGYNLASDKSYTGDWNSVESQARSRWEAQNKGAWQEFKDAIHYAWDKVRGVNPAPKRA